MPTASRKSMTTKGSDAAKAKATGSAVAKALPAGAITQAKIGAMVGHYTTLGPVERALSAATTFEEYSKALTLAKRETRDPGQIAATRDNVKALGEELAKANDAHTSLRVAMVRAHLRFYPNAQDFDIAVSLFDANPEAAKAERDKAKQTVRRLRLTGEILQANAEWNAKAESVGEPKRSTSASAALKAVNAADAGRAGGTPAEVVQRARTGQDLVQTEPKATTGGAIVRSLTSVLDRIDTLDPKGLTPEQAEVVREQIARLVRWEAVMPVIVTTETVAATA